MNTLEKSLAIIEKRNKGNADKSLFAGHCKIVSNALSPYDGYKDIYLQIYPTWRETVYSLIKGTEVFLQVSVDKANDLPSSFVPIANVQVKYRDIGHPVLKLGISYLFAQETDTMFIKSFEDDIAKLMVRYL